MNLRAFAGIVGAVALLGGGPVADAAAGSLTVTGTSGRDDLDINSSGALVTITPAAATSGDVPCQQTLDPVSGRPSATVCHPSGAYDFSVDLGAGNDTLRVALRGFVTSTTASGGTGDDILAVSSPSDISIRAGDGNDALASRRNGDNPTSPVAFDGGTGRDLVDYSSVGSDGGVSASLATGSATLLMEPSDNPTSATKGSTRTDSLIGVERLAGTGFGDVLTGGSGADELSGNGGPDVLEGGEGSDSLLGGDGSDSLQGGVGADTLDGGDGIDEFGRAVGGDTILARDGFAERLACSDKETVVDDLADTLNVIDHCLSVSTAQAKHKHDTRLQHGALAAVRRRVVGAHIACPRAKADRCDGVLRLRLGGSRGHVIASRRYRLRPGHAGVARLRLTAAELRRARGHVVTLDAREVDGDGRARRVLSRTRLRR
jgi:hypothetical protein